MNHTRKTSIKTQTSHSFCDFLRQFDPDDLLPSTFEEENNQLTVDGRDLKMIQIPGGGFQHKSTRMHTGQ